jgi:hypothetical protein
MSDRNTYFSGSLKIELEQTGVSHDGRDMFKGTIILEDGRRWDFDELGSGCGGCRTEISMAESALSFASYYSSDNRDGDEDSEVPRWAPPGELASAIGNAADYTPERKEIPDGMRTGDTDEDESVYWGDQFTIFDSLESQAKWYARMDEVRSERSES